MSRFRVIRSMIGVFVLSALVSAFALNPALARADEPDTLAAVPVGDAGAICVPGAPTFDTVIGAAATALRTVVPGDQLGAYDQRVQEIRSAVAVLRVHRDGLPVAPGTVNERTAFLDDPIVTYLVNGLDAVRTGRLNNTVSVSRLTVNDVIEVFILAARIVKIPAQLAASLVPTAGFFLKPIVGAMFTGVKSLARLVQKAIAAQCAAPNAYPELRLDDTVTEPVQLPAPLVELASSVVRADGVCTPIATLTTAVLVERTRDFLAHSDLPLDRAALDAAAISVQNFLRDNRVAHIALLRRTEELGPIVNAIDYGPVTFLTNLGFDIYEGKALDTVALADVTVENAFDLATLSLDVTSLLLTAANLVAGWTGVSNVVLTPLSMAQTLAFAPTTYGAPILKGVLQSMCAA
ncbi:hypothetical protein [Nocardia colli]|uniref:hypothetical protein n=1 Tax=Nocardia colli TaxID=2545717 RepID=UPI0035E0EAB7